MPYLTHELLKNCTSLVKLEHLNDLCSNLCGFSSDVYGLRAEFGYPSHLMSRTNKNFIVYIGIHKNKLKRVMVKRTLLLFITNLNLLHTEPNWVF